MSEENEWQPVRIAPVQVWNDSHPYGKADIDLHTAGTIVRVRPSPMPESIKADFKELGCDSERSFLIHPQDVKKLGIEDRIGRIWVCEHQIQAD